MTLDEAMDDYRRTFGENFPLMMFMGVDEEDIIEKIYECIDAGRQCEYLEGVTY